MIQPDGTTETTAQKEVHMRQSVPHEPFLQQTPKNPPSARMQQGIPEDRLLQACRRGDWTAFDILVKRHHAHLLRVALRLTRNHEDAQDAVQEAFLKAFQKLYQFQGNAQFSTWLLRIVINESRMMLRSKKWVNVVPFPAGPDDSDLNIPSKQDGSSTPEEIFRTCQLRQILTEASHKLSPRLRTAFVLHHLKELSIEEAARLLGVSQSAIKSRLRRARIQLRTRLSRRLGFSQHLELELRPLAYAQLQRRCWREISSY